MTTSVKLDDEYEEKIDEIKDTYEWEPKTIRMVELGIDRLYEEKVGDDE